MYDSVSNQSMCKVEVMATDNDKPGPAKKFCDHGVSGKFPTNLEGHCHLKKHHPDEYEEVHQNEEKAKKAAKAKAEISATKTFSPQKQLTITHSQLGKELDKVLVDLISTLTWLQPKKISSHKLAFWAAAR